MIRLRLCQKKLLIVVVAVTAAVLTVVLTIVAGVVLIVIARIVLALILVVILFVILSLVIRHGFIPPVKINKLHPYYFSEATNYSSKSCHFFLLPPAREKAKYHNQEHNSPKNRGCQYIKGQFQHTE